MTLALNRPYVYTVFGPYINPPSVTEGTVQDILEDSRSALIKTPKADWRPPTPYSRNVSTGYVKCYGSTIDDSWGSNKDNSGFVTYAGADNLSGYYYNPVPAYPSLSESHLIIKARNKLKNGHINLAQAFGERAQTGRLVATNLKRLAKMAFDLRRLKLPRKEDFFSHWLELQYGWKPLLSDVYGAMEALHEREYEASRGLVSVKARHSWTEHTKWTRMHGQGGCHYDLTKYMSTSYNGYIRLDFRQSNGAPTGTLANLGITNPLQLAWELLPFSFVADWFIPIGDYLSSLDATLGWDFMGGSISKKVVVKSYPVVTKIHPRHSSYVNRKVQCLASGSGRQMSFQRSVYSSPPLPTVPNLYKINDRSNLHVANGIALLASALTGSSRVR